MSTLLNDSSSLAPTFTSFSTAKNLENIKSSVSLAYEKGLMKQKCGLCKMFFHRNSINYKVPCHRIIETERKWGIVKEGRRYENAAFLYRTVLVCCFCSQFFRLLTEEMPEEPIKAVPAILDVGLDKMKLEISTKLERTNIAAGQRTYQSSVVDNCISDNALQGGQLVARTIREVDPWWEVDFSRKFHLHSLSFLLSTYKRQKMTVFVFLLDRPYGYEDPFIDSIKAKAVLTKSLALKEKDESGVHFIDWELPANSICCAVRIQLQGIHPLGVQDFRAVAGDILVPVREADLLNTLNSYATLSPLAVKIGFKAMMSPEMKKELIWKANAMVRVNGTSEEAMRDSVRDRDGRIKPVDELLGIVEERNKALAQWKEQVLVMARVFSDDEVELLYRVIFKYACDLNQRNNNVPNLKETELKTAAAIAQYYPRCELDELHQRLRSVVRWIQSGTHSKSLGCLAKARCFAEAASDPGKHLYSLMTAFKRVETYRQKMDLKTRSSKKLLRDDMCISSVSCDSEGCSWSQFLAIMSLFCQSQTRKIPEVVFMIKDKRAAYGLQRRRTRASSYSSYGDSDGSDDFDDLKSYPSGDGRSVSTYSIMTELDAEEGNDDSLMIDPHWLRELAAPKILDVEQMKKDLESKRTFLQKAREKELFPYYNSTFSEYKFSKFKRRITFRELSFPKQLDLKFAKSLQSKKGGTPMMMMMTGTTTGTTTTLQLLQDSGRGLEEAVESSILLGPSSMSRSSVSLGGMTSPYNTKKAQLTPIGSRPRTTTTTTANLSIAAVDAISRGGGGLVVPSPSQQRPFTSLSSKTTSKNAISFEAVNSSSSSSSTLAMLSPTTSSRRPLMRKMSSFITTVSTADSDNESMGGIDLLGDGDFDGVFGNRNNNKQPKTREFFRTCSLCEVKFPRHAMDKKVLRKHIIELRTSWDAKLISKEQKLMNENNISMYNLVCVCQFCYQFFDPDFDGGIAFPVRVESPTANKRGGVFGAIDSQFTTAKLSPFYDQRFESDAKNIGDVLHRPTTVECRSRALRAIEISKSLDFKKESSR